MYRDRPRNYNNLPSLKRSLNSAYHLPVRRAEKLSALQSGSILAGDNSLSNYDFPEE